ncbi:MAG: 4Fe-4S dicluster domain-containing protein [Dehalococcoidia bacterium]
MAVSISRRRVDGEFVKKIKELSGENLQLCYQCGMCSGNCPAASHMDFSPRQVIELARLGLHEDLVKSKTVWVCASCMACTVACPRGFDLSKLMEAIRLLALRKRADHVTPEEIPVEERGQLPQIAMVGGLRKFTG